MSALTEKIKQDIEALQDQSTPEAEQSAVLLEIDLAEAEHDENIAESHNRLLKGAKAIRILITDGPVN